MFGASLLPIVEKGTLLHVISSVEGGNILIRSVPPLVHYLGVVYFHETATNNLRRKLQSVSDYFYSYPSVIDMWLGNEQTLNEEPAYSLKGKAPLNVYCGYHNGQWIDNCSLCLALSRASSRKRS